MKWGGTLPRKFDTPKVMRSIRGIALTETAVRNAKSKDKAYKLSDPGGLYLFVTPAGGKLWRMKFRVSGKEKPLSFGGWPEIKLAMARKERDKAKESLASGTDPARKKQKVKLRAKVAAANTLGEIAQEFINQRRRGGMSESTADHFPQINQRPCGMKKAHSHHGNALFCCLIGKV